MPLVTYNDLGSVAAAARGMIFDMDGTLVASEKYHGRAFATAMREVTGYAPTPREMKRFKGNTTLDFSAELGREHGIAVDSQAVLARKHDVMHAIYQPAFYPHVKAFLQLWHGRLPLAVATNSPHWFVRRTLQGLQVYDWFEVIVTIDDVTTRKPDPQMVALCAERLGLPPRDLLMFDDSDHGMQAGLTAECRVVFVDPEHPDTSRTDTGPFAWEQLCRLLRPQSAPS